MPTYDHWCPECGQITEEFCKIEDRKQFVVCKHCGGSAERIISATIQRVEPSWLESAKANLHGDNVHTIRDRNDFYRYLKKEGIAQVG